MTIKITTVEKVRQIEAAADASGLAYSVLMENAGRAVAERVLSLISNIKDPKVTVLVGAGNNGGDGLVAGRVIAEQSNAFVHFYLFKPRTSEDLNFKAIEDARLPQTHVDDDNDLRALHTVVASADVVIDAVFGIGLTLPLRPAAVKWFRVVNNSLENPIRTDSRYSTLIFPIPPQSKNIKKPYVIAVDSPSGIDCDTSAADPNTIKADETITFIAAKKGLLDFPAADYVGNLAVAPVSVPPELAPLASINHTLADAELISSMLPTRPRNANKGTFGKVMIVAGSINYVGAAGLTSSAAYKSGAGLVTVASPQVVTSALSGNFLEPTWLPLLDQSGFVSIDALPNLLNELPTYTALLVGPGWGRALVTRDFLLSLLNHNLPPLIVDADALNLLSEIDTWWSLLPPNTIVTPHPGEMARLAKCTVNEVQSNRWSIALAKASEWNVNLVLKGAHTLIANPNGNITALPFKSDALSTAGTGDVLAGLVAGFVGQGLASYSAAVVGGYIQGLAGEIAARKQGNTRSVVAGDVLQSITDAMKELS